MARAQLREVLYGVTDAGSLPDLVVMSAHTGAVENVIPVTLVTGTLGGLTHDGTRLWSLDARHGAQFDTLFRIHPADGSGLPIGSSGHDWNNRMIEINPVTGVVYAVTSETFGTNQELFEIDKTTGQATLIGLIHGATTQGYGLAINAQGSAYLGGFFGPALYSLDLTTGSTTLIGSLSIGVGLFEDLAFDATGQLWGSFEDTVNNVHTGLYTIDLSSMTATLIKALPLAYPGIAFGPGSAPVSYCAPKTNSLGCVPRIDGLGMPSSTAILGFTISATRVRNHTNGLLFYSTNGSVSLPFQGGTLCVWHPIKRTPATNSGGSSLPVHDCTGRWSIDFNDFIYSGQGSPALQIPGTIVDCQWWGRDSGFPAPNNTALSSGLEFVLFP